MNEVQLCLNDSWLVLQFETRLDVERRGALLGSAPDCSCYCSAAGISTLDFVIAYFDLGVSVGLKAVLTETGAAEERYVCSRRSPIAEEKVTRFDASYFLKKEKRRVSPRSLKVARFSESTPQVRDTVPWLFMF